MKKICSHKHWKYVKDLRICTVCGLKMKKAKVKSNGKQLDGWWTVD